MVRNLFFAIVVPGALGIHLIFPETAIPSITSCARWYAKCIFPQKRTRKTVYNTLKLIIKKGFAKNEKGKKAKSNSLTCYVYLYAINCVKCKFVHATVRLSIPVSSQKYVLIIRAQILKEREPFVFY